MGFLWQPRPEQEDRPLPPLPQPPPRKRRQLDSQQKGGPEAETGNTNPDIERGGGETEEEASRVASYAIWRERL